MPNPWLNALPLTIASSPPASRSTHRAPRAGGGRVAPFNMRLQYTPAAIAVPTTIAHVQDAVKCAAKVGVKVNPKEGGHSYASFGLGGESGHLVVELDRMSKITLDSTTQIASVEAGSRLGHVFTNLYRLGKRAISHGTCPGVRIPFVVV